VEIMLGVLEGKSLNESDGKTLGIILGNHEGE